jgi:CRP-like cAMP-binding protein
MNLSKETAKRSATIETCEETTLLSISRDYFNNILLNMLQKELEVKIKAL